MGSGFSWPNKEFGDEFFFFFLRERESFNLWRSFLMIALYHQTKIPISFWCRRELNLRSLIQLSETLPPDLTRILLLDTPPPRQKCKSHTWSLTKIHFSFLTLLSFNLSHLSFKVIQLRSFHQIFLNVVVKCPNFNSFFLQNF